MQELLNAVIQLYITGQDRLQMEDWYVTLFAHGMNGLVYRLRYTGDQIDYADHKDLAVKIVNSHRHNHLLREFETLQALQAAKVNVHPEPLYFAGALPDLDGGSLEVSAWLPGRRLEAPPDPLDKRSWRDILYAYSVTHKLTPDDIDQPLGDAIMPIYHPRDLFALLQARRDDLPSGILGGIATGQLDDLLVLVFDMVQRQWEQPAQVGLIHCDPDPNNMLSYDSTISLVDWEYAGWADPSFEIGDLCAQPTYFDLNEAHRAWIRAEYGRVMDDNHAFVRATVYETMMTVFWVLNLSQQIAQNAHRPRGEFDRPGNDYVKNMQMRYWKRAQQLLGTAP